MDFEHSTLQSDQDRGTMRVDDYVAPVGIVLLLQNFIFSGKVKKYIFEDNKKL